MSAYVVSKKHIDLMVSVAANGTRDGAVPPSKHAPDELGALLVRENVASVSYRYPDDDVSKGELPGAEPYYLEQYKYRDPVYRMTAAELCMAIRGYSYQSCEHPGWEASEAHRLCEQVFKIVAAKVPQARRDAHGRFENWPEMEAAPWGWDEIDVALHYAKGDPEGVTFLWALRVQRTDAAAMQALSDWLMGRGVIEEALTAERMPHDLPKLPPMTESFKASIAREPVPKQQTGRGVHVRVFSGAGNGTITDMTNAGKRGKTCRTLTFLGNAAAVVDYLCTTPEERAARGGCYALASKPLNECRDTPFDSLCETLRAVALADGNRTDFTEREVRGVDAPKPELTAGVPGEWSASAGNDGVSITRHDDVNQWTEITGSRQGKNEAYRIAAMVWPRVQLASTFREASDILTAAGCRLHGFCGMD